MPFVPDTVFPDPDEAFEDEKEPAPRQAKAGAGRVSR